VTIALDLLSPLSKKALQIQPAEKKMGRMKFAMTRLYLEVSDQQMNLETYGRIGTVSRSPDWG